MGLDRADDRVAGPNLGDGDDPDGGRVERVGRGMAIRQPGNMSTLGVRTITRWKATGSGIGGSLRSQCEAGGGERATASRTDRDGRVITAGVRRCRTRGGW